MHLDDTRIDPAGATAATDTTPVTEQPAPDAAPGAAPDGGRSLLDPWASRDEAAAVPEILDDGETIVAVGSGTVLRTARLAQSGWLLVVTDRRLLCIKGKTGNRKVIRIPVAAIKAASVTGLLSRTLVLETTTGPLRVSSIKKDVAESLVLGIGSVMATEQ